MPYGPRPVDAVTRFLRYVEERPAPDCWIWRGAFKANGYGQFNVSTSRKRPRTEYAHRFAYALWTGKNPQGGDLDHLCRNRGCCNPYHLEPVTRTENFARGRHANREKTHCKYGHEYTPENTYRAPSRLNRQCKTCMRQRKTRRPVSTREAVAIRHQA